MQRLVVMRHAKSSWKDPTLSDHQRPLNRRGRESAAAIAEELARLDWLPARVASSDSARTRETWGIMAEITGNVSGDVEVEWLSQLFHAGAATMQAVMEERVSASEAGAEGVEAGEAGAGVLMVLGHNPGCSYLLSRLASVEHRFPTAMAVCLTRAQGEEMWKVEHLIIPREIMARE